MSSLDKHKWQRVRFGDVVRQVKDIVNPNKSGLERYIAGEHMNTDDLRIRRWGTIGKGYLGPAFHMHFRPGQVLYGSRRTYLRKVAVPNFEGICANTTFVLEPKNPSILDLNCCLSSCRQRTFTITRLNSRRALLTHISIFRIWLGMNSPYRLWKCSDELQERL